MLGWLYNESEGPGGENSWKRYSLARLFIGSNNNSRIAGGGGGGGGGEFPVPLGQVSLLVDSDDGVMAAVETLRSEMAAGRR